jgi:hypothetical protein
MSIAFFPGAASAQATRTWVSGVGDDVNPCSRTAPCKTFAGAISRTAAGGEISVLDSGGFGAVTITKSVSIVSEGSEGGILASGTNGIVINAGATDVVSIRGLVIEGAGTGLNGIRVLRAGSVYVSNTVIRGFRAGAGRGLDIQSSTSTTRVYLKNVEINNNLTGVFASATAFSNALFIDNCVVEANTTNSLALDGSQVAAAIYASRFSGSSAVLTNSAALNSFGNNFISGANPTSTILLK